MLVVGFIAHFGRINIFTGESIGRTLTPIYVIFTAVAVTIVGLAIKTVADRKQ